MAEARELPLPSGESFFQWEPSQKESFLKKDPLARFELSHPAFPPFLFTASPAPLLFTVAERSEGGEKRPPAECEAQAQPRLEVDLECLSFCCGVRLTLLNQSSAASLWKMACKECGTVASLPVRPTNFLIPDVFTHRRSAVAAELEAFTLPTVNPLARVLAVSRAVDELYQAEATLRQHLALA